MKYIFPGSECTVTGHLRQFGNACAQIRGDLWSSIRTFHDVKLFRNSRVFTRDEYNHYNIVQCFEV